MSDKQLTKFAREFRFGVLSGRRPHGMCFAVCAPLQTLLELAGVETELVEGDVGEWNHVWLRLHDGRILDPTADQFGLAAVYLGALPPNYQPSPDSVLSR
jgi:hypothetical protein